MHSIFCRNRPSCSTRTKTHINQNNDTTINRKLSWTSLEALEVVVSKAVKCYSDGVYQCFRFFHLCESVGLTPSETGCLLARRYNEQGHNNLNGSFYLNVARILEQARIQYLSWKLTVVIHLIFNLISFFFWLVF